MTHRAAGGFLTFSGGPMSHESNDCRMPERDYSQHVENMRVMIVPCRTIAASIWDWDLSNDIRRGVGKAPITHA
jgi:hypothetical protein